MTLNHYFSLIDVQARMLLKADTSKYKLGVLWWFLEPLMWVCVFYIVFALILDNGEKSGDFIVFLAVGKFAFIWYSKTVVQASGSIVSSQGLIGKVKMPKSIWPMSAVQESLYRQSTVYLLMVFLLAVFGIYPALTWLWMLPVLLVMYLFIVASSLVGAYLVCMVRDFQKFIPLGMTFLLFTSGIFWDVRDVKNAEKADWLLTLNPLAFLIDTPRQVLMYKGSPDLAHLLVLGVVCCAVIVAMIYLMRRYTHYLALKVLT